MSPLQTFASQVSRPNSNVYVALKITRSKNRFRYFRNEIFRGVCVPAACSQQDVEESLNETFSDVQHKYGIDLSMPTYEHMCSSSVEDNPLPTASKATMYVLVFLTIFTVLMTLLHLSLGGSGVIPNETGSFGQTIMMSFSMSNNFERLLRGTKGKNMNILDGLKFYSAVQVLVKHRIAFMFLSMIFNPSFYESEIKNNQLLFMPTLVVETFFIISGFLLFVIAYTPLEKYGIKIIPLMILDRWLRLMPSLLVLIIFTIFLYPHVDNGPIWKFLTISTAESCRKDGWINLLGVNNLYYSDKEVPCLGHLWYLACDMQLFLVGIFLVYMFSRSHSLGLKFALGAFALSVVIPFSIIYINKYDGVPKVDPRVYPEGVNVNYFFKIYIQSYTRAGPYILSIIAGFLLLKIERNQWTLSVPLRWFIIIMSIIVGQGSQYYGLVLYNPNREYGPLENALFGALHRSLWSLMICAIVVIQIAWGLGGKVDEILTHPIYVPLSRLAYLVYLFHPVWQFMTAASTRTPTYLSVWRIIWMTGGDILVVYTSALWLYFIFEAPVNKMRSSLMSKFVRIIEEPVKIGKLVSEKMD